MPTYSIKGPDGKTYSLDGPAGATREQVIQAIQYKSQQQPQQTGMFGQPTDQPRVLQDGEGSDFTRGLGTYTDQYGGILGGAQALGGKAIGSDEQIKKGLERMEESEAAIGKRGIKTAGAMVGTAAAPGPGTATGALTGLVAKNLIERETKSFIESEAGKAAIKDIYKKAGSSAALGAMAGKFGAGEVTGRAIDEAIAGIDDPEQQLAKIKELSTGKLAGLSTAHALANYVGLKIGLRSLDKLAAPTQSMLLNIAKNVGITGLKEAPIEMIQSALEREGANLPLDDREAIKEYVNAGAAGFFMPIIPATIGGVRTSLSKPPTPDTPTPDVSLPEDTPPETPTPEGEQFNFDKPELDRRKKSIKEQEIIDADLDTVDVDLDDADARPKQLEDKREAQEKFDIPDLDTVEQSLKENADVSGLGEPISQADRGSVSVSEQDTNTPGPDVSPTEPAIQPDGEPVVSSTDTTSPATGREGLPQSTLSDNQIEKLNDKIQRDQDENTSQRDFDYVENMIRKNMGDEAATIYRTAMDAWYAKKVKDYQEKDKKRNKKEAVKEEPTAAQPQQEPPARGMERIQVGFENGQPVFEDRPKRNITKEDLDT